MCGISGIFGIKGKRKNFAKDIFLLSQRIKHRGPDGEGMVFFQAGKAKPVFSPDTPISCRNNELPYSPGEPYEANQEDFIGGFAHRRLSILDLSKSGHQPMCTANQRYWISYNGEIYNYRAIRKELEAKGIKFFSMSDTEMLVNAFAVWGIDFLEKISGMFAFVIYDVLEEKLFAARDRFGVKPFYYAMQDRQFIFASEQKAFTGLDFFESGVNAKALIDFFYLDVLEREEEGFFKNIIELRPSHFLQLDLKHGDLIVKRYYELKTSDSSFGNESLTEVIAQTKVRVEQAVQAHLQSDVPVGSCLSGGLDSSAIVGLAAPALQYPIELFTAGFPGFAYDESKWSTLVAEKFSGKQHFVYPEAGGLLKHLDALIYSQDIPLFSTSTFAQHSVMGLAASQGIKVVLDGQGGDELFGGYPNHYPVYWQQLIRAGRWKDFVNEYSVAPAGMKSTRQLVKQWMLKPATRLAGSRVGASLIEQARPELRWLNKELIASVTLPKEEYISGNLNELLLHEFTGVRLKGYLKCEDRAAMWHSVESRTPFTDDHALVEWVFSLPAEYKIRGGINKFLLREAVKGIVPDAIVERKDKLGYVTPNQQWLKEIRSEVMSLVLDTPNPFFNRNLIEQEFGKFMEERNSPNDHRLFKWISFSVWLKEFGFSG